METIKVEIRIWFQRLFGNSYNAVRISHGKTVFTLPVAYGGDGIAKPEVRKTVANLQEQGLLPKVDINFDVTEVRAKKGLTFRD